MTQNPGSKVSALDDIPSGRANQAAELQARGYPLLARILATLALAAIYAALVCSAGFYRDAMMSGFFAFALISTAIIHFRIRPYVLDIGLVLALVVATAILEFKLLNFKIALVGSISVVGISSLGVMALRTIWARGTERKLMAFGFGAASLFMISEYFASSMLEVTSKLHPKTLDLYLYSFDCSLGTQLSFLTGQLLLKSQWLRTTALIFYVALPVPIALVFGWQLVRSIRPAISAMVAFLITGPIGILFYNIFPATGPVHVFAGSFPWMPIATSKVARLFLEPIAVTGARNAIPSLHMAWVLLAWWNSRRLPIWLRLIALAFVIWTVLATLGTGEHYFIDLVVAFPYALLIQGIGRIDLPIVNRERAGAIAGGLSGTLGWLVLLRFGLPAMWLSPVLPWGLVVLTIALITWSEKKLDRTIEFVGYESSVLSSPADRLPIS